MTEVTKAELADYINRSPAIVSRLSNNGVFNECFTSNGKKIYLEKAIRAIIMSKGKDYLEGVDLSEFELEESDAQIFTATNINELNELLEQEPSPSRKIDMMDKFWSYKIRHQKFMEAEGELISLDDAKAAVEALLTPLNQYLDDQSNNIKNHFPNLDEEIVVWISDENNRQKEQLKEYDWEA